MEEKDSSAPLSATIDLTSIQRPDLREHPTETGEKEALEGHLTRLFAHHEKEAKKGVEWGPMGHYFEPKKRKRKHKTEEDDEDLPTAEEKQVMNRRRLILKLRCYQTAFPELLEPVLSPHDLEKLNIKDLKRLLTDVKFTVACKNTCKLNTWSAEGGLAFLEGILNAYTPIRATGLHQLAHDPDFIDIIKEITLDHMDFVYAKPELRALFLICNKLCTTHFTNTHSLQAQPPVNMMLQKPITTEIENIDKEFNTLPS